MSRNALIIVATVVVHLSAALPTRAEAPDQVPASVVDDTLALSLTPPFSDDGACRNGSGGALGLGLQLGWPTGLSGLFRLGGGQAVQFAVGFGGGALLVGSLDYTVGFSLVNADPGDLSLYIGGGVFVGLIPFGYFVYFPYGPFGAFPLLVGIEVPLGARWTFHRIPIDLFLEVAPLISVLPGLGASFRGTLGFRFFF